MEIKKAANIGPLFFSYSIKKESHFNNNFFFDRIYQFFDVLKLQRLFSKKYNIKYKLSFIENMYDVNTETIYIKYDSIDYITLFHETAHVIVHRLFYEQHKLISTIDEINTYLYDQTQNTFPWYFEYAADYMGYHLSQLYNKLTLDNWLDWFEETNDFIPTHSHPPYNLRQEMLFTLIQIEKKYNTLPTFNLI